MKHNTSDGNFWFADFKENSFEVQFTNNYQLILRTIDKSPYAAKKILSLIMKKGSNLINGVLYEKQQKLTIIITIQRIEIIHLANEEHLYEITSKIDQIFYGYHFKSIFDIHFNSLLLNYTNTLEWIKTRENILLDIDSKMKESISINLTNEYSIKIGTIKSMLEKNAYLLANSSDDVYFNIISKNASKSFEELLRVSNVFKSFLDFIITKNYIEIQSMYGIIKNDDNVEELILIKDYKTNHNNKRDKLQNKPSILIPFHKYENKLEEIVSQWFIFSKKYDTLYNYYVDASFYSDSIIDSFFKLISFVERFQREIWEKSDKSLMKQRKKEYFDSIDYLLIDLEIDDMDISIVKKIIKNNLDLTLSQRLKDIFNKYKSIISIYLPIISYFEKDAIKNIIEHMELEKKIEKQFIDIITSKIDNDSNKFIEEREEKYKDIISLFCNNYSFQWSLFHLIEYLLVDKISTDLATYRNKIAHFDPNYYKEIKKENWKFKFNILELTVQTCILNLLGLSDEEINEVYLVETEDMKKISKIIESRIE